MAGEIYIADKATLDTVKTNTNNIKTDTGNILNKLNSGIVDWSNPSLIMNKYGSISNPVTNVFTTILNINGKGYLTKAMLSDISGETKIRITVDGTIKVLLYNMGGLGMAHGFIVENLLHVDNGIPCFSFYGNIIKLLIDFQSAPYPDTSGDNRILISPQPIYFNSNLKIELFSSMQETLKFHYAYLVL